MHSDEGGDGVRVDQQYLAAQQLGHHGQEPLSPRVALLLQEGRLGKVHPLRVRWADDGFSVVLSNQQTLGSRSCRICHDGPPGEGKLLPDVHP